MSATGHARETPPSARRRRWWLPLLLVLFLLPLLGIVGSGTAAAEDTESPEWGNVTRGNSTTIEVSLYDDGGSIDTSTIQAADFALTEGRVENVSVASINASGANRTGVRVSLLLEKKVDTDNVTVSLRDTGSISDEAGNELPHESVTVTGMDSVVPKYQSFELSRVNSSTARISVGIHEPIQQLEISVGGPSIDTLNISGFTERTGSTLTYTRKYTFPEEGEYSLLLLSVTDENGNENSFGRQQTFLYDDSAPNVTVTGPENATVGESVTFSAAETTDDQGIDSVRWQVGSDTILTGKNITVAFASPGSHEVTATAADPLGNTETVTKVVSVTGNGPAGNVTVRQPNATMANVSVNGSGQAQRIQPIDGALVTGQNGTLERLAVSFPRNESTTLTIRSRRPTSAFATATGHIAISQFDIDHGSVPAQDATFTFTVDRDALAAVGAMPDAVTLFRSGDGWMPLSTEIASRGESHIVYRAESPGLSTFVVGVEQTTATDMDAETATNDSEASTSEPEMTEKSTEKPGQPDIVVTNATAVPSTLGPGDRTVITVELENRGTASGDNNVIVALNTSILTTRTVTVPAGETRTTEFARSVPEGTTGKLTVDGQRVGNVTDDSGGLSIPALPSIGVPNPLSLWPDGIVGTVLGGLLGIAVGLYSVLKGLAIYLGY
ncbi:PKD domain-containing protein [Haloarcula sebkhae]|uniref:PKD domain-containing protein n=1 Tax=Haloarcula sebkhae TaxID=932660 RepID=A0ACC6VQ29_9EURY|nr:PKD domain-containing protein [Haloarcula sebkhae]